MAWNEPGGSGDKNPWRQRKRDQQGPPDLDQIVKNIQSKLGGLFGGRKGGNGADGGFDGGKVGGIGIGLIFVVAMVLWIASGFYIVDAGERGVVLRFGKLAEVTEPGLRWHLPFPVETRENVNVQKVNTMTVGYRSNARGGRVKVPNESLMLTEDENIIDIEFAIQYRIKNAEDFLFNVKAPVEETIHQAMESAVREVVGRNKLDFVFENRDAVSQDTRVLLQKILDNYKAGIDVRTVEMQKAQPPDEVKAAFDDAVRAREDKERLKNEAEAYRNDILPRARGAAARKLEEATGYKARVVAQAEGDTKRFRQIAREYAKAPFVTRERLYIDTMEQVLSNTTKIFIDQKAGNNLLYLPLDKLIPQAGRETAITGAPGSETTGGQSAQETTRDRARSTPRRRGAAQ